MSYQSPDFYHPFAASSPAVNPDLELELEILQLRQKLNLEWANQWERLLCVQKQQLCLLDSIFEGTPRWSGEAVPAPAPPVARRRNARERVVPADQAAHAIEAR